MKKLLLILLCSFVCFAFTSEKTENISADRTAEIHPITENISAVNNEENYPTMEVITFPVENGTATLTLLRQTICETGTTTGQYNLDCDNDGEAELTWSGTVCNEHVDALIAYFRSTC